LKRARRERATSSTDLTANGRILWDDLVGFLAEAFLQASPPRNPQFRVDVDDD
jgi:hypothetical protein